MFNGGGASSLHAAVHMRQRSSPILYQQDGRLLLVLSLVFAHFTSQQVSPALVQHTICVLEVFLNIQQVLQQQLRKAEDLDKVALTEVAGVLCFNVPPGHTCDQLLKGIQVCVTNLSWNACWGGAAVMSRVHDAAAASAVDLCGSCNIATLMQSDSARCMLEA